MVAGANPGDALDFADALDTGDLCEMSAQVRLAAKTLLLDPRIRAVLPRDVAAGLPGFDDGHAARPHLQVEIAEPLPTRPDAAGLLKRALPR